MISLDRIETNLVYLVGFNSTSGREKPIATYMQQRHQRMGHETHSIGNNVVARIPGVDPRRAFVIGGHLDTIPGDSWQSDPHTLRRKGNTNTVIGLGVNDMKLVLAADLEVAGELTLSPPDCDVVFIYSAKEQTGGTGTQEVFNWLDTQDWWREYEDVNAILGMPTYKGSTPVLCNGQRGGTLLRVSAKGPTGHSGKDYEDTPIAMQRVAEFVGATSSLQRQWREMYSDPELGRPTIRPTQFYYTGGNDSVVAAEALAIVDFRTTPALNRDWAKIRPELEKKYNVSLRFSWWPDFNPVDRESLIWHAAQQVMSSTQTEAHPFGSDLSTYAGYGVSTLLYGCGDREWLNKPDEEVDTRVAIPYINTLLNLIPAYARVQRDT